ncbi:MAG: restriction endonuclease subunit S [Rhizobiaceae bacterium]|nr:restriction endonuclease subunit S [Rhizobiaceae bacterium]
MVRAGYKQTEVGEIPEDWDVCELRELITSLEAGVSVNSKEGQAEIDDGQPKILKTSCVYAGGFTASEAKIIAAQDILRAKTSPKQDCIIISRMNTPNLVGECGYISRDHDDLFLPDRLWRTKHNDKKHSVKWLASILSFSPYANRIKGAATGTSGSMKNISKEALFGLEIPLPKYAEQKAIADALSDVDALIGSLEKLIAKKRDIKTATMQQLLTGKKRLPGFGEGKGTKQTELGEIPEDWDAVPLGVVLRIRHGKSQKEVEAVDGEYPILATGGVIGSAREPLYSKPSVLIGRKGTIDVPYYMDTPFWTVDTLFYSEISERADPKFLFYKFGFIDWYKYNEASGVPSLSSATIEKIIQTLPPKRSEQEAISSFISDFDNEISHLEKRLTKTKSIKQGMMQELLTGRTRLI